MPPPGFTLLSLLTSQPEGETCLFPLRISPWIPEGEQIGTEEVKLELVLSHSWSISVYISIVQQNGVVE